MTARWIRAGASTFRRWAVYGGVALLLILLTPGAAGAENLGPGGSRVILGDEVVGPYRLLITSSPNPATAGTVTFVVRVSDPNSGMKVRDAEVTVELAKGSETLQQSATHQNAGNPVDYAAHVQVADEGEWHGTMRVNGPAGVSEVTFTQQVSAPRTAGTLILVAIPFAVMLGVFAAMWFVRTRSEKGNDGDATVGQVGHK